MGAIPDGGCCYGFGHAHYAHTDGYYPMAVDDRSKYRPFVNAYICSVYLNRFTDYPQILDIHFLSFYPDIHRAMFLAPGWFLGALAAVVRLGYEG